MKSIIINNQSHVSYSEFKSLYSSSFPIFEQRTEEQQKIAFLHPQYHLIAYAEENKFIGFISYWEFPAYIYIEHFAVNESLRGNGIGSNLLNKFIGEHSKIIILEIDPITDMISTARLRFYQKCGFFTNDYHHIHPAYRKEFEGHSLIVLSTKRKITKNEYDLFNNDLKTVIMK